MFLVLGGFQLRHRLGLGFYHLGGKSLCVCIPGGQSFHVDATSGDQSMGHGSRLRNEGDGERAEGDTARYLAVNATDIRGYRPEW